MLFTVIVVIEFVILHSWLHKLTDLILFRACWFYRSFCCLMRYY